MTAIQKKAIKVIPDGKENSASGAVRIETARSFLVGGGGGS